MGILGTLKDAFEASTQSSDRGTGTDETLGSYWCHDCAERIPARDVKGDDAPSCPDCGDEMDLERSPGSTGCAC
ncbi:zinc-ribbon domain-containing protein [Halogeometricum limi]|uniref:Zinc-ribbon n=1 Tax=Halogeometricum limi TaxID=555875 RepID=A0A1I6FQ10_9EURY|nr:zinc-ribbon domain-containing protein [Halogeometricum limi]SFR32030.1 zinc-ribbon [Halogeometricum limi]